MKRKELLEMCSQIVGAAKRLSNGIVVRPLYKCHATTYERADMGIVVLESYWSVVAVYNDRVGSLYVFGYFSPTTVQHVYKFERWLNDNRHHVSRVVYLYERTDMAVEVDRWSGKRTKLPKETEHEIRNELDYEPLITSRWEE